MVVGKRMTAAPKAPKVSTADEAEKPSVRVIAEDPRPRALLFGIDRERRGSIAACFPSSQVITGPEDVVMSEWDLVVSEAGAPDWLAEHLYVIAFGLGTFGWPQNHENFRRTGPPSLCRYLFSPARELFIPDGLPPPVSQLVRETLGPDANAAARRTLDASRSGSRRESLDVIGNSVITEGRDHEDAQRGSKTMPVEDIRPFLSTRDGFAIAASWPRKGGKAEIWSLPANANRPSWIKAALEVWSNDAPDRFPRARWRDNSEWATATEIGLREQYTEVERQRTAALAAFDLQFSALKDRLQVAADDGERGLRALLTTQGDPLVDAVERVLADFGFSVRNMDRETPEGDRREDVRITDRQSGWTAIAEVRGYKGGAAVNDLMRIQRFATRFAAETGKAPDACWYVVNQFLGKDPGGRAQPLNSNPTELDGFAEGGGFVCDTTEIFRLARSVELGSLSRESVRKALIECRGQFTSASVAKSPAT